MRGLQLPNSGKSIPHRPDGEESATRQAGSGSVTRTGKTDASEAGLVLRVDASLPRFLRARLSASGFGAGCKRIGEQLQQLRGALMGHRDAGMHRNR